MCKKIKSVYFLMVLSLWMLIPFNVYAKPNAEEGASEETTEETTEDTSEESEDEEESDTGFYEENGYWYYREKGTNVVGWKKDKGKWYYFDGKGRMQHGPNRKIGIYELHSDGDAVGIPTAAKFKPEPHGYIYSSPDNVVLKNGHEDAEDIEAWIEELYRSEKRIDEKEIREVRAAYDELSLAEKVRVGNETYLAELELENGIVYDYEEMYASSTDATDNSGSYYEGKSYSFTINSEQPSIDIKIKFSSNNKGMVNIPHITFLSPQEEQAFDISKESVQKFSNDYIDADVTWTDEYVQIDILNAKEGKWKITTDDICRFTSEDYKGVRHIFTPSKAAEDTSSSTDSEGNKIESSEDENSTTGSLILLVVVIVVFVGVMIGIKHIPLGKDRKTETEDVKDNSKKLSKEEEYELLKKELDDMSSDYSDDEYILNENNYVSEEKQEKQEFTQEEIKESLEDYQPNVHNSDPEAETDVLVSVNGNDLRASEYMHRDFRNDMNGDDAGGAGEWFESEE